MKVKELMSILSLCHPEEDVALYTLSERFMTILGLNGDQTAQRGTPVLDVDWVVVKSRPVENPRDVLLRQQEAIERAIEQIDREREAALPKKKKRKTKRKRKTKPNRTAEEQLANGTIPTGKRGRPRKIVTESDLGIESREYEE